MGNTSGQQNQNDYKASLAMGNLPDLNQTSLTYEGIFNSHYFNINKICQNKTLALQSQFAITNNYLSLEQKQKFWAGCFLTTKFDGKQRQQNEYIDTSIVLDISGSMQMKLMGKDSDDKITLAKYSINQLLENSLKPQDRFSLSIFNSKATTVQKFSRIQDLNLDDLKAKIQTIQANGSTNLLEGLKVGIDQFQQIEPDFQEMKDQNIYRTKRVIFITDMCGIEGEQIKSLIQEAQKEEIYVSFIGVGISFNSSLTQTLSAQKGCNYFAVTKEEEVKEVLVDHFYYNYFPVSFDVNLQIESQDFEIQEVFGTPFKTENEKKLIKDDKFQSVTEINTMFASDLIQQDNNYSLRGGLILMKLNKKYKDQINQETFLKFKLSYTDAKTNEAFTDEYELKINQIQENEQNLPIIYSQDSIKRGIIYQQYIEQSIENLKRMNNNDNREAKLQQFEIDRLNLFYSNLQQECQNYKQNDDIQTICEQFGQLVDIITKKNDQIQNFDEINENIVKQQ